MFRPSGLKTGSGELCSGTGIPLPRTLGRQPWLAARLSRRIRQGTDFYSRHEPLSVLNILLKGAVNQFDSAPHKAGMRIGSPARVILRSGHCDVVDPDRAFPSSRDKQDSRPSCLTSETPLRVLEGGEPGLHACGGSRQPDG